MGKRFVIGGGTSGIGREAATQLVREGHDVLLLGRDVDKGNRARDELTAHGPGAADFLACDLSTHQGVRRAAAAIADAWPVIDGLLLGQGVLMLRDARTGDGLHPIVATNYLSRYHLTQRLLPCLRAAPAPTVVLVVAGVKLPGRIDFTRFPRFEGRFPGPAGLMAVQLANYHYAKHLAATEPTLRAAVTNAGVAVTGIMRDMPLPLRVLFPLVAPLMTIPVQQSAANPVWLSTHDGWPSGTYWPKPGDTDARIPLTLDDAVTAQVLAESRALTGA